jgi:hypothetical protein
VKNIIPAIFLACAASFANASTVCSEEVTACELYIQEMENLVERSGKLIAGELNASILSSVDIYKYGEQYVLVKEAFQNDRNTRFIPLIRTSAGWRFSSVYSLRIDLVVSSQENGLKWSASMAKLPEAEVSGASFDAMEALPKSQIRRVRLVKHLDPKLRASSVGGQKAASAQPCFVPRVDKEAYLPIGTIACKPITGLKRDGQHDLSGHIGPNRFVDMSLRKNGSELSGELKDLNQTGSSFALRGNLSTDGKLALTAYDVGGGVAGTLRGSMKDGRLAGDWAPSNDGGPKLPFFLYLQGFPA